MAPVEKADDSTSLDDVEDVDMSVEGEEAKPKKNKGGRGKKIKTRLVLPQHVQDIIEGTSADAADYKFVDTVDVLPPVPKKGNFDVNTIKRSLYFFS